jgi:hypothetical protein
MGMTPGSGSTCGTRLRRCCEADSLAIPPIPQQAWRVHASTHAGGGSTSLYLRRHGVLAYQDRCHGVWVRHGDGRMVLTTDADSAPGGPSDVP